MGETIWVGRLPRWTAGRDGVPHAHQGADPARAACGTPAIRESAAWPATAPRCESCVIALGLVGTPR